MRDPWSDLKRDFERASESAGMAASLRGVETFPLAILEKLSILEFGGAMPV